MPCTARHFVLQYISAVAVDVGINIVIAMYVALLMQRWMTLSLSVSMGCALQVSSLLTKSLLLLCRCLAACGQDRILVFHRGIGTERVTGLLIDQKLDLLMDYTVFHILDMLKAPFSKKADKPKPAPAQPAVAVVPIAGASGRSISSAGDHELFHVMERAPQGVKSVVNYLGKTTSGSGRPGSFAGAPTPGSKVGSAQGLCCVVLQGCELQLIQWHDVCACGFGWPMLSACTGQEQRSCWLRGCICRCQVRAHSQQNCVGHGQRSLTMLAVFGVLAILSVGWVSPSVPNGDRRPA